MQATTDMAAYCFQVIYATLAKQAVPPCPSSIPNTDSPIFVTLKTLPSEHLRGCIGNFAPQPLHKQLHDYALAAAFDDTRFRPVELHELPKLACSVSLLHSFETCRTWDDWEIGKHGIRIRYLSYGATYLPSVASEQGWNHEETMESLLQKGGYRGPVTAAVLKDITVTRYQVSLACVRFSDTPLAAQVHP